MSTGRFRFAVRRLWADRPVTLVAIAILGLGIGANAALFTVVNAVLLRPLPYPAPERLVVLRLFVPGLPGQYPSVPVNAAHLAAWTANCRSCEEITAIGATTTTLRGEGGAEQLGRGTRVREFLRLLWHHASNRPRLPA